MSSILIAKIFGRVSSRKRCRRCSSAQVADYFAGGGTALPAAAKLISVESRCELLKCQFGTAATDSPAARAAGGLAPHLAAAGALLGQPLEVSSLRREDFAFIASGGAGTPVSACGDSYDVLQANTAPTSATIRHWEPVGTAASVRRSCRKATALSCASCACL